MIPKILHYCWFGKQQKSPLITSCIQSWRDLHPDYQIIEWNETNSDLAHPFTEEAYKLKKWAFVSDYIRLKVLYEYGGIYLDTDMMMVKSLNDLLLNTCFFGAEDKKLINAAVFGCVKKHKFIEACLHIYNGINLDKSTNFYDIAIPFLVTNFFNNKYNIDSFEQLVKVDNIIVYPADYFYPFPNNKKTDVQNYSSYIKTSTYTVHLWNASWVEHDEFYYLRNGKYLKSFSKIFITLFISRKFNLYYFKRIYNNFVQSL